MLTRWNAPVLACLLAAGGERTNQQLAAAGAGGPRALGRHLRGHCRSLRKLGLLAARRDEGGVAHYSVSGGFRLTWLFALERVRESLAPDTPRGVAADWIDEVLGEPVVALVVRWTDAPLAPEQ